MSPFILTVVLAVIQTAAPIQRQASNNPAESRQNVESDSKSNKAPAIKEVSSTNANAAQKDQPKANAISTENTKQSVAVRELPPVTIAKDWTDRAYWAFSGLLVFIGGLQVLLLYHTLGAIQRQADIMESQTKAIKRQGLSMRRQTTILRNSVAVTKDSAQRQLRAYVCIPNAMLKFHGATVLFEAQIHAQNKGQTPAYNVDHRINIWIGPQGTKFSDLPQPGNLGVKSSNAMLGPSQEIILTRSDDGSASAPLGSLQNTVFVYGIVTYDDAFRKERFTRFCYIFGGVDSGRRLIKDGQPWGILQTYSEGNDGN